MEDSLSVDMAIEAGPKKRKVDEFHGEAVFIEPALMDVKDVFIDLPELAAEDSATGYLFEFTEGGNIQSGQFASALKDLSRAQKERGIVQEDGEVYLPAEFFSKSSELSEAIVAIADAYVKADAAASELTSLLQEETEKLEK